MTGSGSLLNYVVDDQNIIKLFEDFKPKQVNQSVLKQFIQDVEPKAIYSDIAQV